MKEEEKEVLFLILRNVYSQNPGIYNGNTRYVD
jgi:hypothetical protein